MRGVMSAPVDVATFTNGVSSGSANALLPDDLQMGPVCRGRDLWGLYVVELNLSAERRIVGGSRMSGPKPSRSPAVNAATRRGPQSRKR
jgi:hypothetical protein